MSVQARQVVASTGSIHLQSEDAPVSDDVLALTTTDALLQMFEAWWLEFKNKDCKAGSTPSKLCSLFRGDGVKVSLKPYESGGGKLSFDLMILLFRLISGCPHLRVVLMLMNATL